MDPVSSVTAFLLRYWTSAATDPAIRAIADMLTPEDRRVLDLLASTPDVDERCRQLSQPSGDEWSAARCDRAEQRALRALRHALQRHDLLQP